MDQSTVNLTPEMLAIVPVVAFLLQLLKRIPAVAKMKSWLPLVSVGTSIGLCYLLGVQDPVTPAIVIGLTASGGYDLLRTPTQN